MRKASWDEMPHVYKIRSIAIDLAIERALSNADPQARRSHAEYHEGEIQRLSLAAATEAYALFSAEEREFEELVFLAFAQDVKDYVRCRWRNFEQSVVTLGRSNLLELERRQNADLALYYSQLHGE